MGSALLKKLNNSLPDWIKAAGAPVIRRKLTGSCAFRNQYELLRQLDGMTPAEREEYQAGQLRETLIHAYEHTKYYHDLFDECGLNPYSFEDAGELTKLPLMTKEIIREQFDALSADDVADYYTGETGGSTGSVTKILLAGESIYREKAFIYHFWSKYGYDWKSSRIATFRGVEFNGKISRLNPLYNEILLDPITISSSNIDEYVKKINSYGAEFIHGYPSAIANFCALLEGNGLTLKKKIKAAFCISEALTDLQREIIERMLECPAAAFYGHTERSVFAEMAGDGITYSFNPAYGYTEIIEHGDGNIVCTGFINRKFPLIRYAVDDSAIEAKPGVFAIEGHHSDAALLGRNGEKITQTALNFHNDTFSCTAGYQLVQNTAGEAVCNVKSAGKLTEHELEKIRKALDDKTGDSIQWSVRQVEDFEYTKKGKFRILISNIDKQEKQQRDTQ